MSADHAERPAEPNEAPVLAGPGASPPPRPPTLPAAPPAEAAPLQPVAVSQRVSSVDTLRGFALLGILVMNIIAFGFPSMAYVNPDLESLRAYTGAFSGANRVAWWIAHTFFDAKMMSIFSMLFGAGLVLMNERSAGQAGEESSRAGGRFGAIYYRRLGWLLLIGMIHAYFIWWGDILVAYALCGLVLYPLRRVRPVWLILLGVIVALIAMPLSAGFGAAIGYIRDSAAEARRVVDAGGTLSAEQKQMLDAYGEMQKGLNPPAEEMQRTIARMRGSALDVLGVNAGQAIMLQTFVFVLMTLWRALGMMLIGMGLMKLGVFAAARSRRFYAVLALAGYATGLPLVHVGGERLVASGFDIIDFYAVNSHFNYVGSFGVALGHVGVVMLACRAGVLTWVTARMAGVGRMALTNYLMQSILCTAYFNGWGFGQFATLERAELYIVVGVVWALELIWSPLWLAWFRFGPVEWVWRSLTYWKVQPIRRG